MKIVDIPDGVYDLGLISYDSSTKLVKYYDGNISKKHATKQFKAEIVNLIGNREIPALDIKIGKLGKRIMGIHGIEKPLFGPVFTKSLKNGAVRIDQPIFYMDLMEAYNNAYKNIRKRWPHHVFGLEPEFSYSGNSDDPEKTSKNGRVFTVKGIPTGKMYGDKPIYAYSYRTKDQNYARHIHITCEDYGFEFDKKVRKVLNNINFGVMSVDAPFFRPGREGQVEVKNGKVVNRVDAKEPRMVPNPNRTQVKHVLHYMIVEAVYHEMMTMNECAVVGNRDDVLITDHQMFEQKMATGRYKGLAGKRGWVVGLSCFAIQMADDRVAFWGNTMDLRRFFPELKDKFMVHHSEIDKTHKGIMFQAITAEMEEEMEASTKEFIAGVRAECIDYIKTNADTVKLVDSSVAGGGKTYRATKRLKKGDSLCTFNIKRQMTLKVEYPDCYILSMKQLLHHYDPFGVKDRLGYDGDKWDYRFIRPGTTLEYDEMQDMDNYTLAVVIAFCKEKNLRLHLNGDLRQDINQKSKKTGSVNFNIFKGVTQYHNQTFRCGYQTVALLNKLTGTDLVVRLKPGDTVERQKTYFTTREEITQELKDHKYLCYMNKDGAKHRPEEMFKDADGITCYRYTTHKNKGEEFTNVIIDIRRKMPTNVLYTLITRAAGNVVFLCTEEQAVEASKLRIKRI